jgi:8-oxo-dGTP pyrophosphatase MutT (NUDIX family)
MNINANPRMPADGVIVPLSGYDVVLKDGPHPIYLERTAEIEANWLVEHAANPALFNGWMLMHSNVHIDSMGRMASEAHLSPYSTMLWWRKQPDRPVAEHLFSMAIPVTRDGALLAVEMSAHTANPGRIYCAAGSLDQHDLVDRRADLDANMAREVREETGLDLGEALEVSGYFGVRVNRATVVFRFFRLPHDAEASADLIFRHMEEDEEKEIARPVFIRDNRIDAQKFPTFMPPIIDMIFGSGRGLADIWKQD